MIILEIGLNHQGDEKRAFEILKKVVKTKAEAITFQIREREFYNKTEPHRNALNNEFYKKAIDFAHENNKLIGFAISNEEMVNILNEYGADLWKTLSKDIENENLRMKLKQTNKPLFISTGLSSEDMILKINKTLKNRNIKFIHTQLSQDIEKTNLRAIKTLKDLTKREVAFGLHCSDFRVVYLSLAFEPSDFFFYVREDSKEKYPDDSHAIIIDQVDEKIDDITNLKKAFGTGYKEKMENNLE